MNALRKEFGEQLRRLRRQANLTQEELSSEANVSTDLISLIERGICAPSFDTLEKIAIALKLPVKELFNFQDS